MTTIIKPTVGRVLHFFPNAQYMAGRKLAFGDPSQPLAAVVAYVHSDTMVNLTVWDQNGLQFDVCSVPLVQDGARSGSSFYAAWMDYQKGQAAKTEALESQLAGKPAVGIDLASEQDQCVRVFLEKGAVVKIEGIPVELDHSTVVLTNPANVPLIFPPRSARAAESRE
ncbi:MAG: hypothetical protein ACKVIS_11320 [Pseudomonadales bacterium]